MSYVKLAVLEIIKPTSLPKTKADENTLNTILTQVFILLGAFAFLMIVVAGLRYILARGNAEKLTQAKNMIMYSVLGLIIAALAATIVNIVLGGLS